MFNRYLIIKDNDREQLILFVDFNYEFSSFNKKNISIKNSIKQFLLNNKIKFNGTKILIAVGSVLIATLSLSNNNIKFSNFNNEEIINYVSSNSIEKLNNIPKIEIETTNSKKIEINDNIKDVKSSNKNDTSNNKKDVKSTQNSSKTSTVKKSTQNSSNPQTNQKSSNETTTTTQNIEQKVTIYRKNGNTETLNLEDYVIGVVAAEMPASFNEEAIKAQAILARTYALKSIKTNKKLTDTVSTQAYIDTTEMKTKWGSDYSKYYEKIKKCVNATKGMYITYNNEIIDAVYHSTSNGMTEDAIVVWGHAVPYLKSVDSKWDVNTSSYKREVIKDENTILKLFGIEKLDDISIISRNSSGRVSKVKVGEHIYSGIDIREILGLRSADFEFEIKDNNLIITTKGYGHGVGMSQYGANEMAKNGYSYKQIIMHYYQNVKIESK